MRQNDNQNPEDLLEEARIALKNQDNIYANNVNWKMHELAEMQYESAFDFFIICLESKDSNWRYEALCDVGFHYAFPAKGDLVEKIQKLLIEDPDDHVKIAAAHILGIRSVWPNEVLLISLQNDMDVTVRQSAFRAILNLVNVPPLEARRYMQMIKDVEFPLTVEGLKQVFAEQGIEVNLSV